MPSNFVTYDTVRWLTPEIVVVLAAAGIFVGGAFVRLRPLFNGLALAALVLAGAHLAWQQAAQGAAEFAGGSYSGPIAVDALALAARWFAVVFGVVLVVAAWSAGGAALGAEYLGSLLLAAAGIMIAAAARDIVLLFVGLELISIPTYVLLFLGRRNAASGEATAKYFFLSVLSSAFLLYGLNFLYGIGGGTDFDRIARGLAAGGEGSVAALAPLAWLLVLAGLGFKMALAPFHFYAPDVYQGTTNLNAGLLAVAPKAAGLLALVRLLSLAEPGESPLLWQVLVVLSMATMTIGNLSALWQSNLRRLLAFSSIAHGGYMLIGLAVAAASPAQAAGGFAAALFYLAAYAAASFGAFATLAYLGDETREASELDDLAGLARAQPLAAAALAIFMFSLAGIPPLVGFWGKLGLFAGAVRLGLSPVEGSSLPIWFQALAIVGVLNSAVAAAYYLRLVAAMYFTAPREEPIPAQGGFGPLAAGVACAAAALALGAVPGLLADSTRAAGDSVGQQAPQPLPAATARR